MLIALLLVTPALAREKNPTNINISVFSGITEFPANTAFYILHGWSEVSPHATPGQIRSSLEVDGVIIKPTFVENTTFVGPYGPSLDSTWTYNFPDGMTGQHTFAGHWIVPCFFALMYGYVDSCTNPMADYDWIYSEITITFVP